MLQSGNDPKPISNNNNKTKLNKNQAKNKEREREREKEGKKDLFGRRQFYLSILFYLYHSSEEINCVWIIMIHFNLMMW